MHCPWKGMPGGEEQPSFPAQQLPCPCTAPGLEKAWCPRPLPAPTWCPFCVPHPIEGRGPPLSMRIGYWDARLIVLGSESAGARSAGEERWGRSDRGRKATVGQLCGGGQGKVANCSITYSTAQFASPNIRITNKAFRFRRFIGIWTNHSCFLYKE